MPELELDPRDTIDRDAEQQLFADIVSFATPARVLVISDKLDRGKSTLLRRLKHNCKEELKPAIPACLIDLSDLPEFSPFVFADKMVTGLQVEEGFPTFDRLNRARRDKNFEPFDEAMFDRVTGSGGRVDTGGIAGVGGDSVGRDKVVQGDEVGGDKFAGNKIVHYHYPARGDFTDVREEIARKKCIKVFFEDLRVLCAKQQIVVLLDHWEKCNNDLREWIRNMFMREHCFHPDKKLRPVNLAIVVAGNSYDPAKEKFGIRDDEFCKLFENMQQHNDVVRSLKSLSSDWTTEHMRKFLEQHEYYDVSDEDINYLRACLKRGRTFRQILAGYRGFSS